MEIECNSAIVFSSGVACAFGWECSSAPAPRIWPLDGPPRPSVFRQQNHATLSLTPPCLSILVLGGGRFKRYALTTRVLVPRRGKRRQTSSGVPTPSELEISMTVELSGTVRSVAVNWAYSLPGQGPNSPCLRGESMLAAVACTKAVSRHILGFEMTLQLSSTDSRRPSCRVACSGAASLSFI